MAKYAADERCTDFTALSSTIFNSHGGYTRDLAGKADCSEDELIDFSANINPAGPPAGIRAIISRTIDKVINYPDRNNSDLTNSIASALGCKCEHVLAANGSTELLYTLPHTLPCTRVIIPVPSYSDYAAAFRLAGVPVETLALSSTNNFLFDIEKLTESLKGGEVVIFGQPNNPTGQLVDRNAIINSAIRATSSYFVVDESFADFVDGYVSLISEELPNVIVIKSMTKFYAIPGIRLGFVHAATAHICALRARLPIWSVNMFAQAAGIECLRDDDYTFKTRQLIRMNRHRQTRRLKAIEGIRVYDACANFLLLSVIKNGWNAQSLGNALLKRRIAIRLCDSFEGLDNRYARIAIRGDKENQMIAFNIAEILDGKKIRVKKSRPAPAIMFQGTSSNAGKSVLTAAMCRVMVQDGISVAPFKAQNMSLNSFVTYDGCEMGRAQAVQAQACRLAPDIRMNPILLKPCSNTGSQIIVNGRPVGSMGVSQYFKYKATAFDIVKQSYDSLSKEFGAIVLEGAGSPAEVNLKHHDVVNMRMASYAQSPVLIVGDIDRGGVFASFIGTMETFEPWERKLVAGFIINRFRGDASQLNPAFDYTLRHTGKPVLGVIGHISNMGLPEEDSVTFKCGESDYNNDGDRPVTIGIVDLPHISNYTDFDALRMEPDVSLRIVRTSGDLGNL
ncbi:MAG TPA: cobyric acid synthase, partial [Chitinispirillaceae bacterium]|nr:cobyric acid synthase [Chitinispirillaceae bacterium]